MISVQGCIKLATKPALGIGTPRLGVRAWLGTGASAKRPYLAYAARIELDAGLIALSYYPNTNKALAPGHSAGQAKIG